MTALALTLFGEFQARDAAGREVTVGSRKNRALLAALALAPSGSMPREHLARLLWSDRGNEQARSSLRQALAALRKDFSALDPGVLLASEMRVKLDPQRTEVDAVMFQTLAAAEDVDALRNAAVLYRGEFLADVEIKDPAFEDWLRSERRRFADLATTVLEALGALETGPNRLAVAKRLVALDPYRESAHRKLIHAYAEAGERMLALRQYQSCRDMLRAEFDVAPEAETEALHGSVRNNLAARGEPASGDDLHSAAEARRKGKPCIAVLPFLVLTGEAELDAFSDGLTEDIITGLSRIRALRVIARKTPFADKELTVDVSSLGRQLGADYVLKGSVRKSGTRLRVSAQLIAAGSGHHLWANRIDRAASDVFDVQDEIMGSIVASVQTQIVLYEGQAASDKGADSAAELLARSWQQFLGLTEQSLANSKSLAERAMMLDGGSGLAHRMLAVCLYHQAYMGFIPWTAATIEDVYAHAKLSVEADDADEYSHWAMECAHLLKMEHARALRSLQQALDINPHCSLAHGSIGTVLAWSGQPDAAVESNDLALRLNPDDPTNFFRHLGLALAHYLASRYDKALSHSIAVLQNRPHWWLGLIINIASLAKVERFDDAHRMLEELQRVRPGSTCESLTVLPFATEQDRDHLLAGLREAGMPEAA